MIVFCLKRPEKTSQLNAVYFKFFAAQKHVPTLIFSAEQTAFTVVIISAGKSKHGLTCDKMLLSWSKTAQYKEVL